MDKQKEYFKNLVAIANADGEIGEDERTMLMEKGQGIGLSQDEISNIINNAHEIQHQIPEDDDDKEEQITNMLDIAMADGEFSPEEYQLCLRVANRLGYSDQELQQIIKLFFGEDLPDEISALFD